MKVSKRVVGLGAVIGTATVALAWQWSGAAQPAPAPVPVNRTRFEFLVVESYDAQYLGDSPGHVGRSGGLGQEAPDIALDDPVYHDNTRVGKVTRLVWNEAKQSLQVEFDPEPGHPAGPEGRAHRTRTPEFVTPATISARKSSTAATCPGREPPSGPEPGIPRQGPATMSRETRREPAARTIRNEPIEALTSLSVISEKSVEIHLNRGIFDEERHHGSATEAPCLCRPGRGTRTSRTPRPRPGRRRWRRLAASSFKPSPAVAT